MRMINKIMRSMRDTGLLDGMSDEDVDTLATAALEGMRETDSNMRVYGALSTVRTPDEVRPSVAGIIFTSMIDAALNE